MNCGAPTLRYGCSKLCLEMAMIVEGRLVLGEEFQMAVCALPMRSWREADARMLWVAIHAVEDRKVLLQKDLSQNNRALVLLVEVELHQGRRARRSAIHHVLLSCKGEIAEFAMGGLQLDCDR